MAFLPPCSATTAQSSPHPSEATAAPSPPNSPASASPSNTPAPYHPQTCGKVERFHQTLKKHLANKRAAHSITELQTRLDTFRDYYNNVRSHRANNRTTPTTAYNARVKAQPTGTPIRNAGEYRIRYDRVDQTGKVTLRYAGTLRHLNIGRAHKGRHVLMLVHDRDVRVISSQGEAIASIHLDPGRLYQPRHT